MDHLEFQGWKVRYETQKWGPEAEDDRHIVVMRGLYNLMRVMGAKIDSIKDSDLTQSRLRQQKIEIERLLNDLPADKKTSVERDEEVAEVNASGLNMFSNILNNCKVNIG